MVIQKRNQSAPKDCNSHSTRQYGWKETRHFIRAINQSDLIGCNSHSIRNSESSESLRLEIGLSTNYDTTRLQGAKKKSDLPATVA